MMFGACGSRFGAGLVPIRLNNLHLLDMVGGHDSSRARGVDVPGCIPSSLCPNASTGTRDPFLLNLRLPLLL